MPPLREIATRTRLIDVKCSRCPRAGRLSLARLIAEHGPDATLRDACQDVNADCPHRGSVSVYRACDVFWPQLSGWF